MDVAEIAKAFKIDPARLESAVLTDDPISAAVSAEREACAKLCDERKEQSRNSLVRSGLAVAAADIRARSKP